MVLSAGAAAGGVAGAGGELVFEWNRTDTTQFDGSAILIAGTTPSMSLSIQNFGEWGNALRVTGGGTNGVNAVILATAPIVFPDERRDLIIDIETHDIVDGGGGYAGIAFCTDGGAAGSYHGLAHFPHGTAEWAAKVENGTLTVPGTGVGAGNAHGGSRTTILGRKPSGAPPEVSGRSFSVSAAGAHNVRVHRTGTDRQSAAAYGDGLALGATWNSLSCDRWGLSIQSSGGSAAPSTWDILDLRVYRL
jgi:hypothetical protein